MQPCAPVPSHENSDFTAKFGPHSIFKFVQGSPNVYPQSQGGGGAPLPRDFNLFHVAQIYLTECP